MEQQDTIKKLNWCKKHGWTDPFYEGGELYAFPPGAVVPQKISLFDRNSFFDFLRELVPSKPQDLSSKKLKQFVDDYVRAKKTGLKEKEQKDYITRRLTQFNQLETKEIEEYLEAKIDHLDHKTNMFYLRSMAYTIALAIFCIGILKLFPSTRLWIVPFFSIVMIWLIKSCFQVVFANIDESFPYKSLFWFLDDNLTRVSCRDRRIDENSTS